jgi:hypothetical protein
MILCLITHSMHHNSQSHHCLVNQNLSFDRLLGVGVSQSYYNFYLSYLCP